MITPPPRLRSSTTRVARIAAAHGTLTAELAIPPDPRGVVTFARTNVGERQLRADRQLAVALHSAGFATLLFDLLTPAEELAGPGERRQRVDAVLLARRLIEAIDWLEAQPDVAGLDVGIFGEGEGAVAAMVAACVRPHRVAAIVTYAPALDAASPVLPRVRAPSLLIVSGDDDDDLWANHAAFRKLTCAKELVRIAGDAGSSADATDAEVSRLALGWFSKVIAPARAGAGVSEPWA